jgi:hypothetical protein
LLAASRLLQKIVVVQDQSKMQFNFFPSPQGNEEDHTKNHQPKKAWHFTYLGGHFQDRVKSPPDDSFSLVEMNKGSWAQIVALPRHCDFPIVGVAVGTYLLILGHTERGAVRIQVIGKQVTLASAIAQQVYVRPLYFTN